VSDAGNVEIRQWTTIWRVRNSEIFRVTKAMAPLCGSEAAQNPCRGWAKVGGACDFAVHSQETSSGENYLAMSAPATRAAVLRFRLSFGLSCPRVIGYARSPQEGRHQSRHPRGGIGMAVRQGATVPDISTPDAFQKTLMASSSIVVTDPAMPNASGALTQRVLNEAGVMDAIKPKVKVIGLDPGQEAISKGEAELGFFNISEVRPYVKYAGPVPAPLQKYTSYEAAAAAKA
jgi:hypothetical protein